MTQFLRRVLWLTVVAVPLCLAPIADAQVLISPLELSKKIFGREPFPEIAQYSTGQYTGTPNGTQLPESTKVSFATLGIYDSTAVVAMALSDSTGLATDVYLHFVKDTVWKLRSIRALALGSFVTSMYHELRAMTRDQVEDAIAHARRDKYSYALFASMEEYVFLLRNCELTMAPDDSLMAHFKRNVKKFDALRASTHSHVTYAKAHHKRVDSVYSKVRRPARELFISSISDVDSCQNCYAFVVNNVVNTFVGYIYVPRGMPAPVMSEDKYIAVRSLGNGWYLVKTA